MICIGTAVLILIYCKLPLLPDPAIPVPLPHGNDDTYILSQIDESHIIFIIKPTFWCLSPKDSYNHHRLAISNLVYLCVHTAVWWYELNGVYVIYTPFICYLADALRLPSCSKQFKSEFPRLFNKEGLSGWPSGVSWSCWTASWNFRRDSLMSLRSSSCSKWWKSEFPKLLRVTQ